MRQVATYLSPLIVILALILFPDNQSRYVLPVVGEISGLAVIFLLNPYLRGKANPGAWLMFWLAPLAMMWMISERREGRDVSSFALMTELVVTGLGTAFLLSTGSLKKEEGKLVFAILMTWTVAFFSGQSGGADHMRGWFDFLRWGENDVIRLVIWIRKFIHVTFYGTLMWFFATYFFRANIDRKRAIGFAIAFPLCISICDEYRQSMMPNRMGSYSDVILDMSAAIVVLAILLKVSKKKSNETTATP